MVGGAHNITQEPVVCELCGTKHPEIIDNRGEGIGAAADLDECHYWYHLFKLFGYTVVYECCGQIFGRLHD